MSAAGLVARASTSCSAAWSACARSRSLRVFAGPVVLLHLRPFLADGLDGRIYSDAFYEPYLAWYPELPEAAYVGLLWLGALAAVAMSLGLLTRVATTTTFAIVAYNLFLSTTHFHNNRAYLVIVLGLLAVAPCGRELSLDAWLRRRRGRPPLDLTAPAWPLWLLRFECAAIYGASGFSKLVDPDWFGGTVSWQRVERARGDLEAWPDWVVSVLTDRSFHIGAAKLIVLTELFIALGLWWRGTRYAAVWVAVAFHLSIELSASVQVFSFLAVAVLAIWAVPSTRDRVLRIDATAGGQRRLRALVRGLDWLARFRIEPAPPGSVLELVDRDGTTFRGAPAAIVALSRLPLTAWFALPALLLPVRPPGPPGGARARRGRARVSGRLWRAGLSLVLLLAVAFVVLAPPERCPPVSVEELRRSAQATVDWFVRNQEVDGSWVYIYNADDNSTPAEYNEVRHAGVTMGLYQAAAAGLPGALRSADRGTEWALDRLVRRDGFAALAGVDRVTTGASALLAAGLDIRREATGDPRYDDELPSSGASSRLRPSGRARCWPSTTGRAGSPLPASTRSTTRARRTGRWRACIGPSRARGGARPPTASVPTWPARATRSRTTSRPFPITGPPTERRRPWRSPSAAARRSPATSWTTRAGRSSCSAPRRAGSPSNTARGASWCGAATSPAAAGTAWWTRRSRAGGWPRSRSPGSPTCGRRSPSGRPASPAWPSRSSPTRTTPPAAPGRSGWRAPGSGTARPAWTISSTRSPGLLQNDPDRRGGRGRGLGRRRTIRGGHRVGLAVGRRAAARPQPGPRRVRGPARRALAARRSPASPLSAR